MMKFEISVISINPLSCSLSYSLHKSPHTLYTPPPTLILSLFFFFYPHTYMHSFPVAGVLNVVCNIDACSANCSCLQSLAYELCDSQELLYNFTICHERSRKFLSNSLRDISDHRHHVPGKTICLHNKRNQNMSH